ncbi:TPA: hypothetical protein ACONRF_000192 [Staphylococcus aureus]|nr:MULTISPECIES: hypothetical protein [Staphylococcus]MCS5193503.1 hypothetical protein [Staphylococcus aureus]MCT9062623.1 hypothetical protein [Staphylococcus aureus]MCV9417553.1 hypothetical protein [Staphylococcus aureus]MCZ4899259.1 hypothetical protein [Staphylococcus aureus]MDA2848255.1 hypothetical protein [Staphylococcus aureus]
MRHGLFDEQQLEVWLQAIIGNMDTKDVKDVNRLHLIGQIL